MTWWSSLVRTAVGGMIARLAGPILAILAGLVVVLGARRTGRDAERLRQAQKDAEVQRAQLDAATRRPRDRDALVQRLRDGSF